MKKSICFIVTQGELGGAQRYVYDLATNLEKERFATLVVMGAEKTDLAQELAAAGISVKLANHLRRKVNPVRELLAVLELTKIIKEFRPQILHLNSSKAGVLGSLAGKLAGVKNIIFTAHGFHFLEANSWLIRKLSFWLEKFATLFRKKIICVSEYDRQAAIQARLCPAEKLVTIHNGIEVMKSQIPNPKSQIISKFQIPNSKFIIGTIANLYKTKGLEYLIDAAHILYSKFHILNSKFLIIGEGPERKNLEYRISNKGLKDKVYILGEIKNAAQYLSAFDIFVLPSLKEGFPYTILEAMRAGLPIVATKVGGVPEAVRHESEGFLVEPKDSKALAGAIGKLLADSGLAKRYGNNAGKKSLDFTLEKMLQATERVYRELLS